MRTPDPIPTAALVLLLLSLPVPSTILSAQEAGPLQVVSPLGRSFHAQARTGEEVAGERARVAADPDDVEGWMALGLALAGSWRYQEAIDAFSNGLQRDPFHALLYRHRGHRFISTRRFAAAASDLELSSRLDPSNWDTWYHLGLAHYLSGDFERAEQAYRHCLALTTDDGSLVAVSDWLWMTLMRLDRRDEAMALLEPIHAGLEVGENGSYHQRLLLYKGERRVEDLLDAEGASDLDLATLGYGIGNYLLVTGRADQARAIWQRVVAGSYWPAFGFIAAEAELARGR